MVCRVCSLPSGPFTRICWVLVGVSSPFNFQPAGFLPGGSEGQQGAPARARQEAPSRSDGPGGGPAHCHPIFLWVLVLLVFLESIKDGISFFFSSPFPPRKQEDEEAEVLGEEAEEGLEGLLGPETDASFGESSQQGVTRKWIPGLH